MNLPGHVKTLAPGMSQVIEAGEHYTLTDDNNQELELVGKLDQQTVAFLRNFDTWMALRVRTGETSDLTKAAYASLIESWNNLGNHARNELISR